MLLCVIAYLWTVYLITGMCSSPLQLCLFFSMFVFGDDHHSLVGADGGARGDDVPAAGHVTAREADE